jgi:hypothetical protein
MTPALFLSLALGAALLYAHAISGAIYTSKNDGTQVNGNLYEFKADVYLNGGPPPSAPCTSGGMNDGDYYFQVTNPSGSLLLSSDDISNRKFRVSGGVITQNLGAPAPHANGTGKCPGSISIQLIPFDDTDNPGGEYKVWVTRVSDYEDPAVGNNGAGPNFGFVGGHIKTDNFKVEELDEPPPPPPPNGDTFSISGKKFYDANVNGVLDVGEVGIPLWQIYLNDQGGDTLDSNTTTDLDGDYEFPNLPAGTYDVCELIPGLAPTWVNTTPTLISDIDLDPDDSVDNNFGNVCLGPGGGHTLGFWSNRNGQKLFGADDLAAMVALNLRNADGSHFNPPNYTAFRTWLLGANATNMAYMLSAQLAAMKLNVLNGFVSPGAFIYAPGTTSANAFGFATVEDIIDEANDALGADGETFAGDPNRAYQELLKDVLDDANNNLNFVQAAPCAVNYSGLEPSCFTP